MQEWPIFKVVLALPRDFNRFLQLRSEEFISHKFLLKTSIMGFSPKVQESYLCGWAGLFNLSASFFTLGEPAPTAFLLLV